MAYIVLALGLLMAGAGCYEIYYGSNYISLERGWSAFISGTVLLTGGLLAIALSLAIRALTNIRSALVAVSRLAPDLPGTRPSLDRIGEDPAGSPHANSLFDTLRPGDVPLPIKDEEVARPAAAAVGAPSGEPGRDVTPADRDEAPGVSEPAPIHADEAPRIDDRLDRGFMDRDEEAINSLRRTPAHEPDHPVVSTQSTDHATPEPEGDTTPSEVVHAEPSSQKETKKDVAPATESPVIGRYEAEGTSYIMYADGSIEAQSEAGVYRFASMAELKSFIEG